MIKREDIKRYEYNAGDINNHYDGAYLTNAWKHDGTEVSDEELEELNTGDVFLSFFKEIEIDADSSKVANAWDRFKAECAEANKDPMEVMRVEYGKA